MSSYNSYNSFDNNRQRQPQPMQQQQQQQQQQQNLYQKQNLSQQVQQAYHMSNPQSTLMSLGFMQIGDQNQDLSQIQQQQHQHQNLIQQHSGNIQSLGHSGQQQFGNNSNIKKLKKKKPKMTNTQILRTPIALLNEICTRASAIPKFEIVEEGPVHNRIFECKVKMDLGKDVAEATGKSRTKKESKHQAAKALLLALNSNLENCMIPEKEEKLIISTDDTDGKEEILIPGNPVSELNDLCISIQYKIPDYETISEEGKPHERIYSVTCKVDTHFQEIGKGNTKKIAKKLAAYAVLEKLKEKLAAESNSEKENEKKETDTENIEEITKSICELRVKRKKKRSRNSKSPNESCSLNDTFKIWQKRLVNLEKKDLELPKAKDKQEAVDPWNLLNGISTEQNFIIDSTLIEDSPICVVLISFKLSNYSHLVFNGTGQNEQEAKKNASKDALKFLRNVTKK